MWKIQLWPQLAYVALSFVRIVGSRTGLVMWIAHERRPLALASSYKQFIAALVIVTSSQADSVYFFVTKLVGEPD
jgi:hypothetical protein